MASFTSTMRHSDGIYSSQTIYSTLDRLEISGFVEQSDGASSSSSRSAPSSSSSSEFWCRKVCPKHSPPKTLARSDFAKPGGGALGGSSTGSQVSSGGVPLPTTWSRMSRSCLNHGSSAYLVHSASDSAASSTIVEPGARKAPSFMPHMSS